MYDCKEKIVRKKDLCRGIQEIRPDIPYCTINAIVNLFLFRLTVDLINRKRVELRHWGVFRTVWHKPTRGRNVYLNKTVSIPGCYRIKFKESTTIKKLLQKKGGK